MCARYKSDEQPPAAPREGRSYPRAQAAPRSRIHAERSSSAADDTYREYPPPAESYRYHSELPDDEDAARSDDAFGSPIHPSHSRLEPRESDINPLQEFSRPPRRGMSFGRALWRLCTLPFRSIAFLTRHAPKLIVWPLRILISFAFVGGLGAIIVALIFGIRAGRYDLTQVTRMPERTIVLDRKGNEIGTLHGENRRSITNLHEEVPRYFIDALIMQEDRSFWKHGGIDPRGMLRAVGQVFKHGRTTQGGSTLTMQLAKNTYNHRERNFTAKFTEMALARRIEATYDKETILRCYINRVFWGHSFLGLKAAAYGYFSKQPRDLTIGECAMLAGIVCNPNEFSPYRSLSSATIQRNKVLKLMHDHGHITRNEYNTALAEEIVTRKPERLGNDNYALDLVRAEVDHILGLLDTRDQRIKDEIIFSGGLRVKTTLDVELQDAVMREIDARLVDMFEKNPRYRHQTRAQFRALKASKPREEAERLQPAYLQAACAIIDNATGALLAVIGGRDSTESPLNRALQCRRQVGSVFKPLVYGTFFERGGSPNTLISDGRIVPGEIRGGKRWSPRNSDGRFGGSYPASWGLLKSRNTMAVRVGNRAGLENVINTAEHSGFPAFNRPSGPTIFLGTWEASPLEVASAYTAFANGGVRPTPYIIESITDSAGRTVWQNTPSATRIYSRRTAVALSGILQQITKPGGTAGSVRRLGFKFPCGGKTGTTNNYTNAWFCGFTSDLTAAVWVGFDRPRTIADKAYGGTVALPLWVGAMNCAAARGYAMQEIRTTQSAGRNSGLRLCRASGMLAHSGCEYENTAYIETMTDLKRPRAYCTIHAELAEDPSEDLAEDVADDTSPADDVAEDPAAGPAPPAATPTLPAHAPAPMIPTMRDDDLAEEI